MNLVFSLIFLSFFVFVNAYSQEYIIKLNHDEYLKPCKDYPDNYENHIFNVTNINIEFLDNNDVVMNGNATIATTSKEPTKIDIDFKKRSRGNWVHSVYSLSRPDLCQSIANTLDIPYPYVGKYVPKNVRKCPFNNWIVIYPNISMAPAVTIMDPYAAGDYRSEVHMRQGDLFQCFYLFFELVKK